MGQRRRPQHGDRRREVVGRPQAVFADSLPGASRSLRGTGQTRGILLVADKEVHLEEFSRQLHPPKLERCGQPKDSLDDLHELPLFQSRFGWWKKGCLGAGILFRNAALMFLDGVRPSSGKAQLQGQQDALPSCGWGISGHIIGPQVRDSAPQHTILLLAWGPALPPSCAGRGACPCRRTFCEVFAPAQCCRGPSGSLPGSRPSRLRTARAPPTAPAQLSRRGGAHCRVWRPW